jgi:TPR repeat protein
MVAVLTAAASAGPFEDAAAAYRQGDYTRALRIIRPMARKGYARAQFKLGLIYVRGNGVPQDYGEALRWYRKAAEQGNEDAKRAIECSRKGISIDPGAGLSGLQ